MVRKVTIKDIAKELNISYSMVSRALSQDGKVKSENRERILKKAKEMGYKPNSAAQQLRKGRSNTIGLIIPRINRVFFSNVTNGVETIAKRHGFNVIIYQSNELQSEETSGINTFFENNVAGIIMSLSSESVPQKTQKNLTSQNTPIVMFDRVITDFNINKVINDNYTGAYKAVCHLIEQGYRNIAHFSGPLQLNIYQDRYNGYKKALEDNNIEVNKELVFENILTKEKGKTLAETMLNNKTKCDAIFATSDFSALGAYAFFKNKGISIPSDMGIAGFANEPFTELIGLTSVEQYSIEMGKSAAQLLIEEIESGEKPNPCKEINIKTELLIRNSTLKNSKNDN